MDRAWVLYLNGLPARVPGLGWTSLAVAKYGIVLYAALALWLWWRATASPEVQRRLLLLAVLAAALSMGANAALNAAFPRPRPFLVLPVHVLMPSPPHDPSFPSDHAAVSTSVAMTLLLGGEAGWGALALAGAVLIGSARVVTGVHYPSDIVGGVLVGALCGWITIRTRRPLQPILDRVLDLARRLHLA